MSRSGRDSYLVLTLIFRYLVEISIHIILMKTLRNGIVLSLGIGVGVTQTTWLLYFTNLHHAVPVFGLGCGNI